MESRCRLCAECSAIQIPILEDVEFCSKIFQLFQIRVCVGDVLPSSVCNECYSMVEKTWHFNDRIQKAQEILAELVQTVVMLPPPENTELETSSVASSILDNKSDVNLQSAVVELSYINEKDIVKCDFLHDDTNDLSDESDKLETKRKPIKSKNRVCSLFKKYKIVVLG